MSLSALLGSISAKAEVIHEATPILQDETNKETEFNHHILLLAQSNNIEADYKNAARLFKDHKHTEAIATFSRIISNPRASRSMKNKALIGRSQSFLIINQPTLAIADLKQINYNSSEKTLTGNKELILGVAYIQAKHYPKAIKHLTLAIKYLPNDESAYANRSVAYQAIKNYNAAAIDLETALKLNATPSSIYNLAVLEKERKNYTRCFNLLSQLENQKSGIYANVFLQRGLCAKKLNKPNQALKDFLKAASIDKSNASAIANIGYIMSAMGDKKTAIKYLERASMLYLEQGKIDEYENVHNQMIRMGM